MEDEDGFRFEMRLDILVSVKLCFLRKEKPRSLGIDFEGGASCHDPGLIRMIKGVTPQSVKSN